MIKHPLLHVERYGIGIALCLLAAVVAIGLIEPVTMLLSTVPTHHNEGWNAYFAKRAFGEESLYPEVTELIANNYPPFSFYVIGLFGWFGADHVIAGRVLSLVSTFMVAFVLGLIVHRLTRSMTSSAFAGLLFLAFIVTGSGDRVGTNDPQIFAHALQMLGLAVLVYNPDRNSNIILSSALMFLGFLVKYNLVALPLACLFYLMLYGRRQLIVSVAAYAAALSLSMFIFYVILHENFLLSIILTQRIYRIKFAMFTIATYASHFMVFFICVASAVFLHLNIPLRNLLIPYLLLSLIFGGLFAGGIGVATTAWFDAMISLSILAPLSVAAIARTSALRPIPESTLSAVMAIVLIHPFLIAAPTLLKEGIDIAEARTEREAEAAQDIRYIAERAGPVACEMPSLCYWAGKPFAVHFTTLNQKFRLGQMATSALIKLIAEHHFALFQFNDFNEVGQPDTRRLPPDVRKAIREHYKIDRVTKVGGAFLTPRQ